jgi:hypothetical protein
MSMPVEREPLLQLRFIELTAAPGAMTLDYRMAFTA